MLIRELSLPSQRKEWLEILEKSLTPDIHFHPDYLEILGNHMKGEPRLFSKKIGDVTISLPFFLRNVSKYLGLHNDNNYFDIISPWYYGGHFYDGTPLKEQMEEFYQSFSDYCTKNDIVSEFFRFHPDTGNHKTYPFDNEYIKLGKSVQINTTKDINFIFHEKFDSSTRRAIRKSKKANVEISYNNDEHLRQFHDIYLSAMKAKGARDFYFFGLPFLLELKKRLREDFILITASLDDKVIGGKIFLKKYGKSYYLLGARNPEYPKANAPSRIVYEAVRLASKSDIEMIDLGGGPEGSGLLKFKEGFSNDDKTLYGLKIICDHSRYDELCNIVNIEKRRYEKADFFPEYRNSTYTKGIN